MSLLPAGAVPRAGEKNCCRPGGKAGGWELVPLPITEAGTGVDVDVPGAVGFSFLTGSINVLTWSRVNGPRR